MHFWSGTIRGFTSNGVGVELKLNGMFGTDSTAFSQLGDSGEHANTLATVWNVTL